MNECICNNPDHWGYMCPVHRNRCNAIDYIMHKDYIKLQEQNARLREELKRETVKLESIITLREDVIEQLQEENKYYLELIHILQGTSEHPTQEAE